MNQSLSRFCKLGLLSVLLAGWSTLSLGAEPKVQILSPKDGTRITQEQKTLLVSGKVASQTVRSNNVDIFLIVDVSGSGHGRSGSGAGQWRFFRIRQTANQHRWI